VQNLSSRETRSSFLRYFCSGSILVAEERPVAIVAVGNAFSGGRAGI